MADSHLIVSEVWLVTKAGTAEAKPQIETTDWMESLALIRITAFLHSKEGNRHSS